MSVNLPARRLRVRLTGVALAGGIGALTLLGAASSAHASAGCTSVNAGGWNRTLVGPGADQTIVSGFAAGDTITFTVTITNHTHPGVDLQWWIETSPGQIALDDKSSNANEVYTRTYTVTGSGDTNIRQVLRNQVGPALLETMSVSATCTPASGSGSSTDSQKLRGLQIVGSQILAQASGSAIDSAINGAVANAFGNGGAPVFVGPNGVVFNFAADDAHASALQDRDAESLTALGYAGAINKARPNQIERRWSAWLSVQGTGVDRGGDLKGQQVNAIAGLGYKFTPQFLLGVLAGYESFNYDVASLTGTLKGDGYTVGGYAAWRIAPSLRWHAGLGWTGLGYDAKAGGASGSFSGSRWVATSALTGNHRMGSFIAEPSVGVFTLWENQASWTDSLGTAQASRSFATGRVSAGGRVLAPAALSTLPDVTPFAGLYADWRFASDNAVPSGQPLVGIGNNWSGRVTGGVNIATRNGGSLALSGEYGGIGADYGIWTASARLFCPF